MATQTGQSSARAQSPAAKVRKRGPETALILFHNMAVIIVRVDLPSRYHALLGIVLLTVITQNGRNSLLAR